MQRRITGTGSFLEERLVIEARMGWKRVTAMIIRFTKTRDIFGPKVDRIIVSQKILMANELVHGEQGRRFSHQRPAGLRNWAVETENSTGTLVSFFLQFTVKYLLNLGSRRLTTIISEQLFKFQAIAFENMYVEYHTAETCSVIKLCKFTMFITAVWVLFLIKLSNYHGLFRLFMPGYASSNRAILFHTRLKQNPFFIPAWYNFSYGCDQKGNSAHFAECAIFLSLRVSLKIIETNTKWHCLKGGTSM